MGIGVNTNISTGDIASTTATTTITKPTGTVSTDVLVVTFGSDFGSGRTNQTITPPTGWTAISTGFVVTDGNSNHIRLDGFWAFGNVSNLGFTNSQTGANYQQGWVCVGFTGCDQTTPIDATGTTNSSTASASDTTNAVTVATDQAWHCICGCDWLGKVPFSATGFTCQNNAAANASAFLLYNTTPKSTGSTGTAVITDSGSVATNQIIAAMPFALRPAGGGGGGSPTPQLMMMGCGSRSIRLPHAQTYRSRRARRRAALTDPFGRYYGTDVEQAAEVIRNQNRRLVTCGN